MIQIVKTMRISATPTSLFNIVTDPNQLIEYYPIQSAESEGRVGGRFILRGQAEGDSFTDYGVIEAYDPGSCFRYNYWSTNHGTEDTPSNRMTIEYQFTEDNRMTVVNVTHQNLLTDERRVMMDGVWDYLLAQLKSYAEKTE